MRVRREDDTRAASDREDVVPRGGRACEHGPCSRRERSRERGTARSGELPLRGVKTRASRAGLREVGLDTLSFEQALRRALRQDPDVILIGELRDAETAQTALQAAESGHLVLSTMHTVDAAETLERMVEFFPPGKHTQTRSILAGVLRGVVSQRLLPCLSGSGRVPAVEVMVTNTRIADLIREARTEEIPEAIAEGSFFQMQTFSDALIELVLTEQVDREVAANAATNRHDFLVTLEHALKRQAADTRDREAAQRPAEGEESGFGGLRVVDPVQ
jgi:twitching motility protein PilT